MTVDIDQTLLQEALRLTRAKTAGDVIHRALTELVRRSKIERLRAKLGRLDLNFDGSQLARWRADE